MENWKKAAIAACIAAVIGAGVLFAGPIGQKGEERAPAKTEITITDYRGREVTLTCPVENIVLLQHHAAWAIRLFGAQDKVVGIAKQLRRGPYRKLADKPVAGWWMKPNYEKIAKLHPDLVITFWPNPSEKIAEKMERKLNPFGIKVIFLRFTGMRTSQFEKLAKILGKEEKAGEFLEWRGKKLDLVEEGLKRITENVRVYNEPDMRGPWWTRPERSINFAGGKNIADEILPPHALEKSIEKEVSPEWVLKKNPEVVILGDWPRRVTGYGVDNSAEGLSQVEKFKERPGMGEVSAVENGRVYVMDYMLTAGAKSWLGALYMAKIFYPNHFEGLHPEQIHKEFYENWLGLDYQGIYVIPQPPWAKG